MAQNRTRLTKKDLSLLQPRERELYQREGFDRSQIRYEFANTNTLGLNDRYIEDEEVSFLDMETVEYPQGPTGLGETAGSGVDFIVQDGKRMPTYRYTMGFTELAENVEAGAWNPGEQRTHIMNMISFFHDRNFLKGVRGRDGNVINGQEGIFDWLKASIPANRTFDCGDYADGTVADLDSDGRQENILKYYAFKEISGRLLDNESPMWDLMIGRQEPLALFNQRTNAEGGTTPRQTYWERLNTANGVGVGVRDWKLIPDELVLSEASDDQEPVSVDMTTELGNDEVIVLPDMNQVTSKYWQLYEQGQPRLFDSEADGGRSRFDYVWRYRHRFDPTGEHSQATDAIHLTNLSELFG